MAEKKIHPVLTGKQTLTIQPAAHLYTVCQIDDDDDDDDDEQ